MMISAVPKEAVGAVWADVARVMNKSVDTSNGKYHIDDLFHGIQSDLYVLWVIMEEEEVIAAITTRIIEYPGKRAMAMDWIGGSKMGKWLPIAQETLEKFAKDNNCTHLEGYGRKAWGRWLGKYGWNPEYIAYRMEISNG
jgi:hypothetical protein|tara:strand:- start:1247 stop:1666 length:420 start_codon:yes stop_codon:yes gene_type:complete